MSSPVFNALVPVVLLIAMGYVAGRRGWIADTSVRDLSNLVFLVLMPALLFRSMSSMRVEQLDFRPIALYFLAALILFFGVLAAQGRDKRATVIGLAAIFSNTAMLGLPLIRLAYGEAGFVLLVTLVSLHALVLLTVVTVVLELMELREQGGDRRRGIGAAVFKAVRNSVIHPVPLPIIAGLAFGQTGLSLPAVVDQPLQLLGAAFAPIALLLVGVTLARTPVGPHLGQALRLSLLKNLLHPVLMLAVGWVAGLRGLALIVMVVAAAMPVGANVFLFSQRYRVAEDLITATVAVSTGLGLLTLTLVMTLVGWIPH